MRVYVCIFIWDNLEKQKNIYIIYACICCIWPI